MIYIDNLIYVNIYSLIDKALPDEPAARERPSLDHAGGRVGAPLPDQDGLIEVPARPREHLPAQFIAPPDVQASPEASDCEGWPLGDVAGRRSAPSCITLKRLNRSGSLRY